MKRNTKLALAVIAATAIGGAVAMPVLAHGSGDGGYGRDGAHQGAMGSGMMGNPGRGDKDGDHGRRGGKGGMDQMGGGQMGGGQMKQMMQRMMQMQGGMGGMQGGMGGMGGKLFGDLDANGDGLVTPDEAKAGREAALKKYDANGDGALSLSEFQALFNQAVREKMVDRFQALDSDGDGQVTAAEVTAPADKMARMQKAAKARAEARAKTQGDMMKAPQGDMMQAPQTETAPKN